MATSTDSEQQPAGWNEPFSERHLAHISNSITDWKAVSPFLGLTEAEENAILGSNPHSVPSQRIAMLRKWKQNLGAKATYRRLCRAFVDCKRADLVDNVKQVLTAESSSSSDEEGMVSAACDVILLVCSLFRCGWFRKCTVYATARWAITSCSVQINSFVVKA